MGDEGGCRSPNAHNHRYIDTALLPAIKFHSVYPSFRSVNKPTWRRRRPGNDAKTPAQAHRGPHWWSCRSPPHLDGPCGVLLGIRGPPDVGPVRDVEFRDWSYAAQGGVIEFWPGSKSDLIATATRPTSHAKDCVGKRSRTRFAIAANVRSFTSCFRTLGCVINTGAASISAPHASTCSLLYGQPVRRVVVSRYGEVSLTGPRTDLCLTEVRGHWPQGI